MRTVDPGSTVPLKAGVLSLAPEAGWIPVSTGVVGGALSSTYVMLVEEQLDVLPAASVAVARKVVDESSVTETVALKELPLAAAVPTTALVQVGLVKRRTVVPASVVPRTLGWLLLAGDNGCVPSRRGTDGAVLSST